MNQDDRRRYLIEGLLKERPEYENMQISSDVVEQKMLLRLLMNIRMPGEKVVAKPRKSGALLLFVVME